LLKELAKEVDLEVYYFSDSSVKGGFDKGFGKTVSWDMPLLNGYTYHFLKNHRAERGLNNNFLDVWNPGAWKVVWNSNAEVILLNGWTYSSIWLVLLIAKLRKKKVWLRAENPLNQELKKSKKIIWAKKVVLQQILFRRMVNKCLFIGTQSKSFFKYYGVQEERLVYTPYAVDNTHFRAAWENAKGQLPQIKEKLALPKDKKIILFSGKYISKKNPLDLLKAFACLDSDKYFLLMVGDGPLRPVMEQFIQTQGIQNVLLTGFVNQSEIPLYYAVADVFVMCSGMGETWGLAVNEAMNFGKPVIVSDTCGCSSDLVKHNENGFIFNEGNTEQLANYLQQTLDDDNFRERAGRKSLEIIDAFSIEHIVHNIHLALNK